MTPSDTLTDWLTNLEHNEDRAIVRGLGSPTELYFYEAPRLCLCDAPQ